MKTSTKVVASAAMALLALSANAQSAGTSALYGELGYSSIGLKVTDGTDVAKADPGALIGTIGYQLHRNLAVEGFAGFGLTKDEVAFNGASAGVDAKIASSFGVFLKPSVRATESLELFGRVGYARSKLDVSAGSLTVSESDNDVAWGIGINYDLTPSSYLQWNWTNFYDKDGLEAKGWAISYGKRF